MLKALIIPAIAGLLCQVSRPTQLLEGIVVAQEDCVLLDHVVIWVKGTHQGMITGNQGMFDVEVGEGDTLEFSARGFITKEVIVGSGSLLKVILQEEANPGKEITQMLNKN